MKAVETSLGRADDKQSRPVPTAVARDLWNLLNFSGSGKPGCSADQSYGRTVLAAPSCVTHRTKHKEMRWALLWICTKRPFSEQPPLFPPLLFLNSNKNVVDVFHFFLPLGMVFSASLTSPSAWWRYHLALSSTPKQWEELSESWSRSTGYICSSKPKWVRTHSVSGRTSGGDCSCPHLWLLFPPERPSLTLAIHWTQSLDCAITRVVPRHDPKQC